MGVVEPSVVCVVLHVGFAFFFRVDFDWIRPTGCVASPLAVDGVLLPLLREDFTKIELIEVGTEVFVPHPPVAVVLELVVQLLL